MPETGTLADKPAPEIFREMAAASRSGVLRLASDKRIRVVVFEKGRPVFAMSNIPEDQLDTLLVRQRRITPEQAGAARRQIQKATELGPKLLAMGAVDAPTLEAAVLDQIVRIVQSAMLTRDGEYTLDTALRGAHDVSIEAPIEQWLLDTARNVTAETARALLGPPETLYTAAEVVKIEMSPLDSFLFARVTRPMTVDEIRRAAEFTEEQGLPGIYALYASGLLVRVSNEPADIAARQRPVGELRTELDRLLTSYRDLDYYDVLQVTRRSDSAELKQAYYALAKLYHPDRYQHTTHPDIREKLEAVFGHISRAYETLKDERTRTDYDRRIGVGGVSAGPVPVATVAPAAPTTPVAPAVSAAPGPSVAAPAPPQPSPAPPPPAAPSPVESSLNPGQLAEQNFQEGLRSFENRDVMRAVHLFREALRLAPDKGLYHFNLGLALTTNPRWYKEAEKHLLEAARTDPINTQIFLKLGQIYQESGLKRRAEAQYRAVLGIDPYNRPARRALAAMGFDVPPDRAGGSSGGTMLSKLFKKK